MERFCALIVIIISPERISYEVEIASLRDRGISSAPYLLDAVISNLRGTFPPGEMIGKSTELGFADQPSGTGGEIRITGIGIGPSLIILTSNTPESPPAGQRVSTPNQK